MPNKKINELTPRTPTLTDLIIIGDPSSGFSFKATLSAMVNFVGGNIQFSSLGGISLTSPTNGQVLTFNGTNWVNQTPAAAPVSSVFGRTGAVVAAEGDYSLNQLSDVTISSPTNGQVLKYNGTAWVNGSDTDTGITSLNGLTATTQTFATGTSGTDFNISSTTSAHTFNLPTASATNRGALSSSDWTTFNAKQNAITLATIGNSGAATFISNTLNIPNYTLAGLGGITLNSLAASSPLSYDSITGIFSIQIANSTQNGYLSSLSFNTFTNKQNAITLTTTGSSGSATFVSDTLNIPTYTLAGLGGISLSSLSASAPLSYNSGTGAFSITQASGSTNGFLSSTDWTTFNNKQSTITLTTTGSSGAATFVSNTLNIPNYTLAGLGGVSGSGTTNYVSKFTGTSALGNSQIFDNGTNVGIGTTSVSNVASERVLQLNALSFSTFRLRNDANTVTTILSNNASGWGYVGTETNHPFLFLTNNTEKARLTAAGRLLLGTTTESTFLLDVNGTARVSGTGSQIPLTLTAASGANNTLVLNHAGSFNATQINNSSGAEAGVFGWGNAGALSPLQNTFYFLANTNNVASANMKFVRYTGGVSFVTAIMIASDGKVGINNTSQSYQLDITGDLRNTTSAYFATSSGSVGIGTTTPHASAELDVTSTTSGFLPPRMSGSQAEAIASPAAGLLVYANNGNGTTITSTGWWGYDGAAWVKLN